MKYYNNHNQNKNTIINPPMTQSINHYKGLESRGIISFINKLDINAKVPTTQSDNTPDTREHQATIQTSIYSIG